MLRMRLLIVLLVAIASGTTLAAAPRYFASLQVEVDPLEVLQRRVDVLQMQLQELSDHAEPDDGAEPLAATQLVHS